MLGVNVKLLIWVKGVRARLSCAICSSMPARNINRPARSLLSMGRIRCCTLGSASSPMRGGGPATVGSSHRS